MRTACPPPIAPFFFSDESQFLAPKDQVSRAAKMLAEEYVSLMFKSMYGFAFLADMPVFCRVLHPTSSRVSTGSRSCPPLRRPRID